MQCFFTEGDLREARGVVPPTAHIYSCCIIDRYQLYYNLRVYCTHVVSEVAKYALWSFNAMDKKKKKCAVFCASNNAQAILKVKHDKSRSIISSEANVNLADLILCVCVHVRIIGLMRFFCIKVGLQPLAIPRRPRPVLANVWCKRGARQTDIRNLKLPREGDQEDVEGEKRSSGDPRCRVRLQ